MEWNAMLGVMGGDFRLIRLFFFLRLVFEEH